MRGVCIAAIVTLAVVSSSLSSPPVDKHAPKDLSDETHFEGKEHNAKYDREAFLGEELAQTFDQLSPAEAKRRLGLIVDKIDKDRDGSVTEDELRDWVHHVSRRYLYEETDRHWGYHDDDNDGKIPWEEYKQSAYGMVQNLETIYDHHRNLTYGQTIQRDHRRFLLADSDNSKHLSKDEFSHFLYPHEAPHMREIFIDETMEDMDKNKDGYVELEEFINDVWPMRERDGQEEPDWLSMEKNQFHEHRDKDKDGRLDREEVGNWISPKNLDPAKSEAKHLIHEADSNKDKELSKAEILDHQDLFVGSQATEHGGYFVRHEEF